MGGRGAFLNVNTGNFTFVENGRRYVTLGEIDGIQIREVFYMIKA